MTDDALTPAEILKKPYARHVVPEADGTYRAEIVEFPGCIATGDTAVEALIELEKTAEGWLTAMLESGRQLPAPIEDETEYSGKLVVRLPKSLHRTAAHAAKREGVSLNQLISVSVASYVGSAETQFQFETQARTPLGQQAGAPLVQSVCLNSLNYVLASDLLVMNMTGVSHHGVWSNLSPSGRGALFGSNMAKAITRRNRGLVHG